MHGKRSRFIYMIAVGVLITLILQLMVDKQSAPPHNRMHDFLLAVSITVLVWEGNLWLNAFLDTRLPWMGSAGRRLALQLLLSLTYSVAMIYGPMWLYDHYVCSLPEKIRGQLIVSAIVLGVMVTIITLSFEIGRHFFGQWKSSLVEVEKYKAESLQAQLQNLKDQINPHFLFNNMSVLSSLVYRDQDKAVEFINQLSKVYRYLLDNRGSELVTLDSELLFIRSYTYLLQIRFDTNIEFEFDVNDRLRLLRLPPMALQVLIENAIKHNEVSSEQPLHLRVKATPDWLEVSNNLQLRINSEPGCGTGLKNIRQRYSFFTEQSVEVNDSGGFFTVRIPLLSAK